MKEDRARWRVIGIVKKPASQADHVDVVSLGPIVQVDHTEARTH
jgi:hypothetical protein